MLDTSPEPSGPLPVWPCFFMAVVATIVGVFMVAVWWPRGFPDETELVMISGDIATVRIKDDISGTSAGALLPAATSVYFTFKDRKGEFYYPSTQPDYRKVRDFTAVNIDIWVEAAKVGGDAPLRIWQLREHNPYNYVLPATVVEYDAVTARLTAIDRSMVRSGALVLVLAFGFALFGVGLQRLNRYRDPSF